MPGILLGNIQFQNQEIPDFVRFGDKQVLAIHMLMGGTRVIDAIGPSAEPISWSGLFLGTNAAARARAVDQMAKSGSQVNLNWGTFAYTVVVSDFRAIYKHDWEIRYQITCEVINQDAGAASAVSLSAIVSNDMVELDDITSADPAVPALTGTQTIPSAAVTALTTLQNQIDTSTGNNGLDLGDLSLAEIQPVINAAEDAYTALSSGNASLPQGIDLDASTPTSTIDGINAFVTEANAIMAESDVHTALGYLGRIVGNLSSAGG